MTHLIIHLSSSTSVLYFHHFSWKSSAFGAILPITPLWWRYVTYWHKLKTLRTMPRLTETVKLLCVTRCWRTSITLRSSETLSQNINPGHDGLFSRILVALFENMKSICLCLTIYDFLSGMWFTRVSWSTPMEEWAIQCASSFLPQSTLDCFFSTFHIVSSYNCFFSQ